jgi:hypothetical protein
VAASFAGLNWPTVMGPTVKATLKGVTGTGHAELQRRADDSAGDATAGAAGIGEGRGRVPARRYRG